LTQDKRTLPQIAKEKLETNPSALGDPVSLKAEKSSNEPTEQDRPNKNGGKDVSAHHILPLSSSRNHRKERLIDDSRAARRHSKSSPRRNSRRTRQRLEILSV